MVKTIATVEMRKTAHKVLRVLIPVSSASSHRITGCFFHSFLAQRLLYVVRHQISVKNESMHLAVCIHTAAFGIQHPPTQPKFVARFDKNKTKCDIYRGSSPHVWLWLISQSSNMAIVIRHAYLWSTQYLFIFILFFSALRLLQSLLLFVILVIHQFWSVLVVNQTFNRKKKKQHQYVYYSML